MIRVIFLGCFLIFGSAAYAADWHVSADLRERYQNFNNFDFNSSVDKDTFELDSRLYVKAKADFGHGFTAYIQRQAVLIRNNTKTTGTQSLTQSDLYQAYVQYQYSGLGVHLGRLTLVGLYGLFSQGAAVRERNGGVANNASFGYVIGQYVF